uniref:Uncharacterized protein n=1 Tax=Romanomermis culicivorax TaxID=13658 RepID=A0A915JAH7_ROMCU
MITYWMKVELNLQCTTIGPAKNFRSSVMQQQSVTLMKMPIEDATLECYKRNFILNRNVVKFKAI